MDSTGFNKDPALTFSPPVKNTATRLNGKKSENRIQLQKTLNFPDGWQPGAPLWLRWFTGPAQSAIVAIDDLEVIAD
jgi:hypothetical protein